MCCHNWKLDANCHRLSLKVPEYTSGVQIRHARSLVLIGTHLLPITLSSGTADFMEHEELLLSS